MQPVPYDFIILSNKATGAKVGFAYTPFTTTNYPAGFTNNSTNTIIVYRGYTFLTNAVFYDWREAGSGSTPKRVEALEINITYLTRWLTNASNYGGKQFNDEKVADAGHNIMGIYVYNAVPFNAMQLPAVRLANGARLPVIPYPACSACPKTNGLTVATKFPMYVKGNFNSQSASGSALGQFSTNNISATTNTYPAALMADSITILSTNWRDSYINKNPTGTTYGPSDTTINAAVIKGIVASVNPSAYSGGLENFLRLLEDWNSGIPSGKRTLTYNGSICVLFESQFATNRWGNGCYGVPSRNWAFDVNFNNPNLLPPMTPLVINSNSAPKINSQPQSQTVIAGQSANLTVDATGVPAVSYQWIFNGTNLLEAMNNSLALTDVQTNQAGNYTVLVTNVFGAILSSNAVLTIATQPALLAQPTNQTILVGEEAFFSVIASGTTPLSYQWQLNQTNLLDATNTTLTLTTVALDQAGSYSVTVSNLAGGLISSNALLSVYATAVATLNAAVLPNNHLIQFDIAGVPGFHYDVQGSTNLIDWQSLTTNAAPFSFTDTNSPDFPQRFYRANYLP